MANFTSYGANAILDGTALPATLYAKLHIGYTGLGGAMNGAAEDTRIAFTRSAASGGACANDVDLAWLNVAASEDYSHISYWDHITAGNCWIIATLAAPAVIAGDDFVIATGDLDFALSLWT